MSDAHDPSWFHSGDVPQTVREARSRPRVDESELATVLADRELGVEVDRVRDLLADLDPATEEEPPERTEAATHDDGPPQQARRLSVADVQYLDRPEFARVIGGVVTRYGGKFQLSEPARDTAVDLFWNRQYTTAALRVEPLHTDETVSVAAVRETADGETDPAVGRSVSTVAIVSNRPFESGAGAVAEEADIDLVGPRTLRRWFADVRLSRSVVSDLIRAGQLTDEEYADLLDDVSRVLPTNRPSDPFHVVDEQPVVSEAAVDPEPEGPVGEPSSKEDDGSSSEGESSEQGGNDGTDTDRQQDHGDGTHSGSGGDARGTDVDANPVECGTPSELGTLYDEKSGEDSGDALDGFLDGLGGDEQ
jgi:hypothetical protein